MLPLRSFSFVVMLSALHGRALAQHTFVVGGKTMTVGNGDQGTKCPGILSITGGGDGYCCVLGNISTCEGWPICDATATAKPVTCATKIPISASDYTSLIESASSKYLGAQSGDTNFDGSAMPSSTTDSTIATATGETTSGEQATETGYDDSGAADLNIPSMTSIIGGAVIAVWIIW